MAWWAYAARPPEATPTSTASTFQPTEKKRVHRGGSFLWNDHYCARYMVGTRGKGEVARARITWAFVS
jgi:hypothetical protein